MAVWKLAPVATGNCETPASIVLIDLAGPVPAGVHLSRVRPGTVPHVRVRR
jgi:hypothetical protein